MMFNVRIGWSTDCDGNVTVNDNFEAEDIQEAEEYVKRNYLNEDILDELQDESPAPNHVMLTRNYLIDESGEEVENPSEEDIVEEKFTLMSEWVEIYTEDEEQ